MKSALLLLCAAALPISGCAGARTEQSPEFPIGRFQAWSDHDPAYRLYPGDTISMRVPSAPELDGEMTVAPDGRVRPPLADSIMVADLTLAEAEAAVEAALASQLLDSSLDLSATGFDSQRIFVGGEVNSPGGYDLPAGVGALEAVLLAGGFRNTAATNHVVIVRRAPGGAPMLRVVDIRSALSNPQAGDPLPLQRFDVVFVPRSTIAEVNLFIQQYVRDALPVQFGFFYDLSGSN